MTTDITEFLFPAPAPSRATAIISWWENRRLAYNGIVGAAGLFSYGVGNVVGLLVDGHLIPLIPVVVFGVMANVCYCLGPIIEIALRSKLRGKLLPVGPTLFRMGLTFSVGLALLPGTILAPLMLAGKIVAMMLHRA